MDTTQLRQEIDNGKYDNKMVFPYKGNTKKEELIPKAREYRDESNRLRELFKSDALTAVGLHAHKKADAIFEYAWREGHSGGYGDVLIILMDLAELFGDP